MIYISVSRIFNQKQTVTLMIKIYCNKHHNTKDELCPCCLELLTYAINPLDNCRYGENKHNC